MAEEFSYIDRCALLIRPTWKFAEWLNQVDDQPMADENAIFTQTVYLVEEVDRMDAHGTAALLESHHVQIAASEFAGWWTDENDWPPIRNINDFFQYFECSVSEIVIDLLSEENYDN